MKNKIVYRKERKEDNTQLFIRSIPKSIIEDTNLSGNALRLILSILGDNDENFNLSETTYCNRLQWSTTTFYRAIDDLIKCGYVKRTLIADDKVIPGIKKAGSKKKVYFYTISEYGNLKKETPSPTQEEEVKVTTPTKKNSLETSTILKSFNDVLINTTFKVDTEKLQKYIGEAYKSNKLNSVEQLSTKNIIKVITKFKINEIETESTSIDEMKEMVEERSNGLTKDNKAAILARIIKRYKEEPTMTKSQIAGKILSFKTEYRKPVTGNQD